MFQHYPPADKRARLPGKLKDRSAKRNDKNRKLHPDLKNAFSGAMPSELLRYHVLVVHHRADIAKIIAAMFKRLGCHAVTATDTTSAMHQSCREPFDLVFTELDMPHLDGYQLTRLIKQKVPRAKTAIMTSCCQAEVVDLINHGASDAWLFKPFKLGDLCRMLAETGLAQMVCTPLDRPRRQAS